MLCVFIFILIYYLLQTDDDEDDNGKYFGVSVSYLQTRLKNLEDENRSLRGEANRLAMQTDEVEAKEAQLMSDFASQLSVTRSDLSVIMEQADKHRDENVILHNNCEFLRSKLANVEASLKIVRLLITIKYTDVRNLVYKINLTLLNL